MNSLKFDVFIYTYSPTGRNPLIGELGKKNVIHSDTVYLLLVVFSEGLAVSMGSGELRSLELLRRTIEKFQLESYFYESYFSKVK